MTFTPSFTDADVPADVAPEPDDEAPQVVIPESVPDGYRMCPECGVNPVKYSGRGRVGKCDTCKPLKSAPVATRKGGGPNEKLALQATALLVQVNSIASLGLYPLGFPQTSSAIAAGNAQFEVAAYQALLADPALCRTILRAGSNSGKVSLILAYAMLAMSVVPTAFLELKERRALKAESVD